MESTPDDFGPQQLDTKKGNTRDVKGRESERDTVAKGGARETGGYGFLAVNRLYLAARSSSSTRSNTASIAASSKHWSMMLSTSASSS